MLVIFPILQIEQCVELVIKTFLPLILSLLISCQHEVRKNNMLSIETNEKPGTVIILNGPSASGKSSIQSQMMGYVN